MKNLILLFAAIASFYSCTKETDDMAEILEYTGKWELIKMTGSLEGSEYTGLDMEWQESYMINENRTFTKTRIQGDEIITISGTYSINDEESFDESESEVKNYIRMFYDTKSSIISSCGFESETEFLYFISNKNLVNTWNSCDGPGLEYIKKQI